VKRLILIAAVVLATFASACNSGSNPPPPPPVGGFTNASLKGQYTFSMAGADGAQGLRISRIGSFIADGNGHITGALEDVFSERSINPYSIVSFNSGTYSLQANGYGILTLNINNSPALGLSIVLQSSTQGLMIQNDTASTSSGSFQLASASTPANFSSTEINGNYVFDVSGVSSVASGGFINDAAASLIGQFKSNGSTITGGTVDLDDGNQPAPSGPLALSAGNTFQLDPTNGNGANFGRGTLDLTSGTSTFHFVFYLVNNGRVKLMEENTDLNTLGDALLQPPGIPTTTAALMNNFAFLIGGNGMTTTTTGPLGRAGRFTMDGSGNVNTIFVDQNFNGAAVPVTPATISNNPLPTYSIDTTPNIVGSGRGTVSFTDSQQGSFDYVFYLVSPTDAVLQDQSPGVIGDGAMQAQTGNPFTTPVVATNFAFNWSGVSIIANQNNIPFEQDFVGQYTLPTPSGQTFNGAMDVAVLGSSGSPFIQQDPITVTQTIKGNGTQSNDYVVVTGKSPTATYTFKAYFVNPGAIFLVSTNNSVVLAGIVSVQGP